MSGSELNTKLVTIPKDVSWGRDAGKSFLLTEMPAGRAEKWAMKLFLVLKGSDGMVPADVASLGMVGVAIVGLNVILRADIDFNKLEPLLDEMMTCVQSVPNLKEPSIVHPLIEGEIKEPRTFSWLRSAVLELHTGFSIADALSKLILDISKTMASLNT